MAAPVVVNFKVAGVADVLNAFRSVQQATQQAQRSMQATASAATRTTQQSVGKQHDAHVKAFREYQKLEAQKQKSAEKTAKEQERTAKKAADEVAKAAKKAADEEVRSREAAERRKHAIMMNSAAMAGRIARQQADKEIAEAKRAAEAHQRWARGIGGTVASAGGRALGTVSRVAGAALAVGGGFSAVDALRERMANDKAYAALANSATGATLADGTKRARPNMDAIKGTVRGAALSGGLDESEVLGGLSTYQALANDLEGAMSQLPELVKLAKASGTGFGDMMGAMGALRVQNKNLSGAEVLAMMRNVVAQGKEGSIELKSLAEHAGVITATSGMYAGDQATNQGKLLGLAQIARRTSGSDAEAATTISRVASDALKHRSDIKSAGIDAFTADGQIKGGPDELIAQVIAKTKGNLGKIQSLGFGERSIRAFQNLSEIYRDAEAKKAGSGEAAVRSEMGVFTSKAGYTQKNVNEDFAAMMATDAEQVDQAFRQLKDQVGTDLLPVLRELMPKFKELLPHLVGMINAFAKFVEFFAENKLAGIGMLIGGAIVKDIAMAGLGGVVTRAIAALVAGASGGGLPGMGAAAGITGLGARAGAFGAVAGTAAAVTALGIAAIDHFASKSDAEQKAGVESSSQSFTGAIAAGKSGDIAKKKSALAALEADRAATVEKTKGVGAMFGSMLGVNAGEQEMYRKNIELTTAAIEQLKKQIEEMTSVAERSSDGLRKLAGGPGDRTPMIVER